MTKLVHLAREKPEPGVFTGVFLKALDEFGGVAFLEDAAGMPDERKAEAIRPYPVLLTCWSSAATPACLAADPGKLSYVCNVTGTVRHWVPLEIVEAGIPVTNWGDAPAQSVAEGAVALLLATLKDLHERIRIVRDGDWGVDPHTHGGSLDGLAVGVYGLGVIGRRFVEMLRPFRPVLYAFDPYVEDMPEGVTRVGSLEELFDKSQAVVIHAGLSDETRNSVTADLLARLPDHGVVVNTARGGVIDQAALLAELKSGRLRAGLDVLEPDVMPPGHPARTWPNVILSCHSIENGWPDDRKPPTKLQRMHEICIENLRSFFAGRPLRFRMDRDRYLRST